MFTYSKICYNVIYTLTPSEERPESTLLISTPVKAAIDGGNWLTSLFTSCVVLKMKI